jgi:hypothetical protein
VLFKNRIRKRAKNNNTSLGLDADELIEKYK